MWMMFVWTRRSIWNDSRMDIKGADFREKGVEGDDEDSKISFY